MVFQKSCEYGYSTIPDSLSGWYGALGIQFRLSVGDRDGTRVGPGDRTDSTLAPRAEFMWKFASGTNIPPIWLRCSSTIGGACPHATRVAAHVSAAGPEPRITSSSGVITGGRVMCLVL